MAPQDRLNTLRSLVNAAERALEAAKPFMKNHWRTLLRDRRTALKQAYEIHNWHINNNQRNAEKKLGILKRKFIKTFGRKQENQQ